MLTTVETLIGAGFFAPVANSPPLKISIYAANGGLPSALLGTRQIQASKFHVATSFDIRETIDFTSLAIPLVQGQQYLIAFETPYGVVASRAALGPYFIGYPNSLMGVTASQARNGIDWEVFTGDRELAIEVRAIPIPEPSSLAIILLGATLTTARYRRSVPRSRV